MRGSFTFPSPLKWSSRSASVTLDARPLMYRLIFSLGGDLQWPNDPQSLLLEYAKRGGMSPP